MRTLLALLVLSSPLFAQDKVDVKPAMKKGLKYTRTMEISAEGGMEIDGGGVTFKIPSELDSKSEMSEEILEAAAGEPKKSRRLYKRKSSTMTGMGQDVDQNSSLEGRIITFEMKDGKPTKACDGAEAADLELESMTDALTLALASGKAVAPGSTWDADGARTKAWLATELSHVVGVEISEAKMECELRELRDKFDQKCARIEIEVTAKGKMKAPMGNQKIDVAVEFKAEVFYSIDNGFVVGLEGKGTLEGTVPNNGQPMQLKMPIEMDLKTKIGEANFEVKAVEKPKKPERYPEPIR